MMGSMGFLEAVARGPQLIRTGDEKHRESATTKGS